MQRVLYEWRNLPKQHGYSPAELLFGRSQQLLLPQPAGAFSPIDMVEAAAAMDKKFEAAAAHYDRDKVSLSVLQPGQFVFIQCDKSKKWDRPGEIIEVRPDGLSYLVNHDGKVVIRGRAMLKPVMAEQGDGQVQDQGQGKQQEGVLTPSSVSSPAESSQFLRRSQRLKDKEEETKWSSSHVPTPTARAMPLSFESLSVCRDCTANKLKTQRTRLTNRLGDSPSLTFNGRPSPQGPQPSSSVPSCSSLVSSAAGYGPRISAGPRGSTPSSWTCSAGPQVDLSPSQTRMPSFPGPSLPFPSLPLPRTGGSALPPGGLPCQKPISVQSPPSMGFPSSPIHSFPWLSTTVDTSPTASVGFLAAGGIPSTGTPRHTVPSWNSGSPASPRLTPYRTPSSVAPELAHLPVRPLVSPWLRHRRFGTVQPALSRVPGRAKPPTRIPSSLQLPSTSPKKRSALSGDKKTVIDPPSGQGSIQNEERSVPRSSLET